MTAAYLFSLLVTVILSLLVTTFEFLPLSVIFLAQSISVLYLISASLQRRKQYVLALTVKTIVIGSCFYSLTFLLLLIVGKPNLDNALLAASITFCITANFILLYFIGFAAIVECFKYRKITPSYAFISLQKSIVFFAFSVGFIVANQADIVMLKMFSSLEETGQYSYVSRVCALALLAAR